MACRALNTDPEPVVGVKTEATATVLQATVTTTPTSLPSPTISPVLVTSAASLTPTSPTAAYTATPTATITPRPTATSTTPTATATPGPTRLPALPVVVEAAPVAGQIGGYTGAVAVRDNYAYLGVGPRLVVLDISRPAQPILVGQSPVLAAVPQAITLTGTYAYVASKNGNLIILDVADPADPRWLGAYIEDDAPRSSARHNVNMALAGNVVYIVSTVPISAQGITVVDNYAYVTGEHGLTILDVASPAAPGEVSSGYTGYGPPGPYDSYFTSQVAAAGGFLYLNTVTTLGDGRQDHLCVVDVSNRLAPALVDCYEDIGQIRRIIATMETIFVTSSHALYIIAAASPLDVRYIGLADTWSVAVMGEHLYVAAGQEGLYILRLDGSGEDAY
ncbi:MAG TPA: hypothetical protein VF177_15340 [Anaerolineae bacterium]